MPHETVRHVLATLAYRTRQVLKEIPEGYPEFEPGGGLRSPLAILHHMTGLFTYALHCFDPAVDIRLDDLPWEQEKYRLGAVLVRLDAHLANGKDPQSSSLLVLLQGPILDAMTHVGQLAMLRRMAGLPVAGENFTKAAVRAGELEVV
jgi:hypothetical protein